MIPVEFRPELTILSRSIPSAYDFEPLLIALSIYRTVRADFMIPLNTDIENGRFPLPAILAAHSSPTLARKIAVAYHTLCDNLGVELCCATCGHEVPSPASGMLFDVLREASTRRANPYSYIWMVMTQLKVSINHELQAAEDALKMTNVPFRAMMQHLDAEDCEMLRNYEAMFGGIHKPMSRINTRPLEEGFTHHF